MVRKKLKAILALLVAMLFVLQAVPMYTFAAEANDDASAAQVQTNDEQTTEEADATDEDELNFVIDENGDYVELTDELRTEIYAGEDEDTEASGYYAADIDGFFSYDDGEVQVATEDVYSMDFSSYAAGTTEVPGWTFKTVSKEVGTLASTVSVENASGVNALKLDKVYNGAKNGLKAAGDEAVYAVYDMGYGNGVSGNIILSADVYSDNASRAGLFFYGQTEDFDTAIATDAFPYLGRAYLWDSGTSGGDALSSTPTGLTVWTDIGDGNGSVKNSAYEKTPVWKTNTWYNMRFEINTDTGLYTFIMTDESGEELYNVSDQGLTKSVLNDSDIIQGIGFTIQNDVKTAGNFYVKNLTITDNNSSEQDALDVAADSQSLAIPDGTTATAISDDFDLPTVGSYGSTITWSSSRPDLIDVDANGHVTVNRPAFTGSVSVNALLTATLTKGLATATRTLTVGVLEIIENDEQVAEADKNVLEIPTVDADGNSMLASSIETDFVLPVTGTFGSKISYTSSDESLLSIDNTTGKVTVTRPAFSGAGTQNVTITATVTYNGAKDSKNLSAAVKELDPANDAQKAIYDANTAFIGGIDLENIRQSSFYLEDQGTYGTLTWTSSDDSVIAIKSGDYVYEEDGDDDGNGDETITNQGGFTATVTRPSESEGNKSVILTVTANVNGYTATNDFVLTVVAEEGIRAFPSVEGYGSYSLGGRGGQVYHVTTLAATGPGSLQYGVESMSGARIIVFDVGGVIDLTPLGRTIAAKGEKGSNITVAGQTAPYPGITLKGYGFDVSNAHDVIIRNIKIRCGDVLPDGTYNQSDPMSVTNAKNLVVDHCSLQWAIDMDFRLSGEYITMSNVMFGKNLSANSSHEKGGHAYVGAINEGSSKVTFAKNFIGDSTQRSPRIVDAIWVDAYNNILYNCGNGFDIMNYEWQDKNELVNVYNNYARSGPSQSNGTPYRTSRGRVYSGGIMVYFQNNYTNGKESTSKTSSKVSTLTLYGTTLPVIKEDDPTSKTGILYFGKTTDRGVADLSNITLDEWNNDSRSYDNNNKTYPAGTLTYMPYMFPAPRGQVLEVKDENGTNTIAEYAESANGIGATKPARDLFDTMIIKEMNAGRTSSTSLTEEEVVPFFEALEARIPGRDYTAYQSLVPDAEAIGGYSYTEPRNYKTSRKWNILQGVGPTLKGASSTAGKTKPVYWDNYTDVNKNTNPDATTKYDSSYVTNFEVGDWWGEYCGSPGQQLVYKLYDNVTGATITSTDTDFDGTRFTLISVDKEYVAVERTVADLFPSDWMIERDARHADEEGYRSVSEFLNEYRNAHYPYTAKYENYDEYYEAYITGNLDSFDDYDQAYTSTSITWDTMGDGIPNWYKEYRGWSTTEYIANVINPETGYTYVEEYINFMADDEPLELDSADVYAENFKVNNIGYATAQVFWNTDYRATCVIEYGPVDENGNVTYITSEAVDYTDAPDNMHTYHSMTLVGLDDDTTYAYRITTTDEFGNVTVAEDPATMRFSTTAKPAGNDILPSVPTVTNTLPYYNQVKLEWSGDVATDESYEIYYDTVNYGDDYTQYAHSLTGIDVRETKQIITGLENNVEYYFLIVAVNTNGRTPSEVISATPSGVLYDFDFPTMTAAERSKFMSEQFMYTLGGNVTMQLDPDTGEYALQMLDETNSHGVNTNLKMPVTQDEKFTYELTMKVLYQKQTDALNTQIYDNGNAATTTGADEHNTWQINFYKDSLPNDDMDSTSSLLWDSAFSVYFNAADKAINTTTVTYKASNETFTNALRYDGTYTEPTMQFINSSTTNIGTYNVGRTYSALGYVDTIPTKKASISTSDLVTDMYAFPLTTTDGITSTAYPLSKYGYRTNYGDALYSHIEDTDKTLHGMWFYEKGSADYVTYRIVVDPVNDNVSVYADGELVYGLGAFIEDLDEPFNIGKIELKSRNDGYSWVNIKSIKIYTGDGTANLNPTPASPTTPGGSTPGGSTPGSSTPGSSTPGSSTPGGVVGSDTTPTPVPTATTVPESAKYFDDLSGVEWAVEPINALAELGIINGTGDRQFSPNNNVTRAEYATMLMRAFGEATVPSDVQFTDVESGEWYTEAIGKAVALGVVNGYDDGTFGINDNITREDMMVMAYRTMTAFEMDIPANIEYVSFDDQASISDYAVEAIEKMYSAEIINGVGDNLLDPKGTADRAQAAKVIYGLIEMEGTVNE